MPQDPWAEFRVGAPQQGPSRSDPVIAPPNPYKQAAEQRAQASEQRANQDQAIQAERLRLAQEANARANSETQHKREKEASGFDATEGERKAGAFLIRALGANKSYEGTGVGPRSLVGQTIADTTPGLLNSLPGSIGNSPERQVSDSAQDEFIAASLRQDSGAAIPPEELERQRRIYFPMPGDGPEAIEQKRQARLRAIEGLKQSSGRLLDQTLARWDEMAAADPSDPESQLRSELDRLVRGGATLDQLNAILPPGTDPIDPQGYQSIRDYMAQHPEYQGGFFRVESRPAEGAPPPNGGGAMDEIARGIPNTLGGLAQGAAGATYDFGASIGDALDYGVRQVGGAGLDVLGFDNAAEWWRDGYRPSPTASDAIEQIFPTAPGQENARFASQIVGSMMVPVGPKAAPKVRLPTNMGNITTPAREVIEAGKNAGVRVMTSDVRQPTTFTGKIMRATGERIPYAGTGGPRAAQQDERVQAVKDLAQDFGADVAGDYLDNIAADLAKTRGNQISNLVKVKDGVIDSVQGAFQAPRTVQAIDQEVARLKGINEGAFAPVIRQLEAFKANIVSGKSLREVEGNRKLLGDMFEDPSLASIRGDGQKAINAIYGPLRDDMGAFIKAQAGDTAYSRWAATNKRLATLAGELDSAAFKSVLDKAETTPEQVSRLLFNKQPSEVRKLYSNLSPAGQQKARAGIIAMAIKAAGGIDEISPDKFARAIADNAKAAGVVFEGADLARLQGLQRLLQATKQASVASAAPPNGVQNSQAIGGYMAGATGPISIPLLASYGGLARLYESPKVRDYLIGLSKTKPGTPAEGQWIERILKAAAAQTERMGNVANDNVGLSAAASNTEKK